MKTKSNKKNALDFRPRGKTLPPNKTILSKKDKANTRRAFKKTLMDELA